MRCDIRRIGGERGLRWGGRKKSGWGVSWRTSELSASTPTSGRLHSPERGGVTQDGGTRGGAFHGEIDRCRESQGWTTACSSIPERNGKDRGEDSPKQAGSCWFARHSSLATSSGANLYPPGGCCVVFLWCYVCSIFVSLSSFLLSLKPRPIVQSLYVLRYACAPTAQLSNNCLRPFSFLFLLRWRCRFFRVFLYHYYRFLFVWRVRRTCFPFGWCFSTL